MPIERRRRGEAQRGAGSLKAPHFVRKTQNVNNNGCNGYHMHVVHAVHDDVLKSKFVVTRGKKKGVLAVS